MACLYCGEGGDLISIHDSCRIERERRIENEICTACGVANAPDDVYCDDCGRESDPKHVGYGH